MRNLIAFLLMGIPAAAVAAPNPIEVLDRFVTTGTMETGRIQLLADLRGPRAVNLIFGYVLDRLEGGAVDQGLRNRLNRTIEYAARESRTEMDEPLKAEIKEKADRLLHLYAVRSHTQGALLEVFDGLSLWTNENFWFVLKSAGSTEGLAFSATRLRLMIPLLSEEQQTTLASTIRKIRPYSLTQLSLLMDSGALTEAELVTLFKLAAKRFAEIQSPSLDHGLAQYLRDGAADRVFAETFDRVSHAIQARDVTVLSALNKARGYWERQKSSPRKGAHMRFFDSILNEKMTWRDSNTWFPKPFPVRQPRITSVEGNVILAQFRITKKCGDDIN